MERLDPEARLPFGKYSGWNLGEVPNSYLHWLCEQDWFEDKYPSLLEKVEAELKWRDYFGIKV